MEWSSDSPAVSLSYNLKQATLELINRHQKLDSLISEVAAPNNTARDRDLNHTFKGACLQSVLKSASLLKQSTGCHGDDQCAAQLLDLVKDIKSQKLTQNVKNPVEVVLQAVKVLISNGEFSRPRFQEALYQKKNLPLELHWLLHTNGVLGLESYLLQGRTDQEFLSSCTAALSELLREPEGNKQCFDGILGVLVEMVFSDQHERKDLGSYRSTLMTVIDQVILGVLDEVIETWKTKSPAQFSQIPVVSDNMVVMETQKKVYSHLLPVVLSHRPELKVSQAIQDQHQWTYGSIPAALVDWYKQILLTFDPPEILDLLGLYLDQDEINWQLVLSFVSVFVVCMPESSRVFTEFTERLLRDGLEESDAEKVITGLLLSRQACCHGPHVYYTYADWFEKTFADGSRSPACSRKTFSVLMKFLTDLVPYETAQHLKVHITRHPFIPAKSRPLFTDYVTLAKTRLRDLQDGLETQTSGDDKMTEKSKQQEQARDEVEQCVAHFSSTSKVPSSIMEASIFRKPYYVGVFLPALLSARPLPDVPDAKMKLIQALKGSDKIPSTMYNNYKTACKRATAELLDGVFEVDDSNDDINNMMLEPVQQLEQCLIQMTSLLKMSCDQSTTTCKYTEQELLCLIVEKLKETLKIKSGNTDTQSTQGQGPLLLNVDSLNIPEPDLKVADIFLNWITKTVALTFTSNNPQFPWLPRLLTALTQFPALIKALYARLWSLAVDQMAELKSQHIQGLSSIVAEVQLLGDRLPWLQLTGSCDKIGSLTQLIVESLPVCSAALMENSLGFLTGYLSYLITSKADNSKAVSEALISAVVHKFMFLCTRMVPELRNCDRGRVPMNVHHIPNRALVTNLFLSQNFQNRLKDCKMTVQEWLKLEMSIETSEDFLSPMERHEYHVWAIYSYFLEGFQDKTDVIYDIRAVAMEMLEEIVDSDTRCRLVGANSCTRCTGRCAVNPSKLRPEIISLLQELAQLIGRNKNSKSKQLPWLQTVLKNLLAKEGSQLNKETSIHAFFRVALCLPAYLLLTDTQGPDTDDTELCLSQAADTLNNVLVEYLNRDVFIPVAWTLHLLQGIVTMTTNSRSFLPGDALNLFCKRCPVFHISMMVHNRQIESLLQVSSFKESEIVTDIEVAGTWLEGVARGDNYKQTTQHLTWCCSVTLLAHTLHSDVSTATKTVEHCCKLAEKYDSIKEILKSFWHIFLFHMAYGNLICTQERAYGHELFTTLVNAGVPVLFSPTEECVRGRLLQCVSQSARKMASLVLIRLACQAPVNSILKLIENGFESLLKLFSQVASEFEKTAAANSSCAVNISQAVTLDDITSVSTFIRSCIREATPETLVQIDMDLLQCCGADILDCVLQRLAR